MKARSNLWRQLSEAWFSRRVGTQMMLASAATVTSAPRACSLRESYAISPNGSPARSRLRSLPRFVTFTSPCARMQK